MVIVVNTYKKVSKLRLSFVINTKHFYLSFNATSKFRFSKVAVDGGFFLLGVTNCFLAFFF